MHIQAAKPNTPTKAQKIPLKIIGQSLNFNLYIQAFFS